MAWYFTPHTGGKKIPPQVQDRIRARVLEHARRRYGGRYDRLDVRFRGALCYIFKGDPVGYSVASPVIGVWTAGIQCNTAATAIGGDV